MPVFDHFSTLAPLYDRLIQPPQNDHLMSYTRLPSPGRLLYAGGGTGRIAQRLIGQVDQIIVADQSVKMLREAKDKGSLFAVGSETEQLPFPDGCFSRVLVVDAYHHIADQSASLVEFWRVLEPGGRLVIEEPDIDRFAVKLIALAEKLTFFQSHFERAELIAERLSTLDGRIEIVRHDHNAWILADK